jgi:hypothetical protein
VNEALQAFLSLPDWLTYAIIGAAGGAVGALLGQAIARAFKISKAVPIAGLITGIIAIQLANIYLPKIGASVVVDTTMSDLSQRRLYRTLFRFHPEAEPELRARMTAIIESAPEDEIFLQVQAASAELVDKYLTMDLPSLPDAMMHKLLLRQVEVMQQFQGKPASCVAYYLGKPKFERGELAPEFIEIESNLKADAFEGAAANPTKLTKPADEADLGEELALAYVARGYPVEDLEKLGSVEALPAEEGCRLALQFVDAITALGPAQSAYLFKNLLLFAERTN